MNDAAISVQQTSDSGYIVSGYTSSSGAGDKDVLLMKFNEQGNFIWAKTAGGVQEDVGFWVEQTPDGDYLIAGHTYSYGSGPRDSLMIKYNQNGDLIWARTAGDYEHEEAYCVQIAKDGGYVWLQSTYSFGFGELDIMLAKTDTNGDIEGCQYISPVSSNVDTPDFTINPTYPTVTNRSLTISICTPSESVVSPSTVDQCYISY